MGVNPGEHEGYRGLNIILRFNSIVRCQTKRYLLTHSATQGGNSSTDRGGQTDLGGKVVAAALEQEGVALGYSLFMQANAKLDFQTRRA